MRLNIKSNIFFYFVITLLYISIFTSCESEFEPEIYSTDVSEIVVEGYIEASQDNPPPYLILTKSFPFNAEISLNAVNDLFIHDATVAVSDGTTEVLLQEICVEDLTPEQLEEAAEIFGFDVDSLSLNFCVYIDISGQLIAEEGKTYNLEIIAGDKTLTASTTIPFHTPLDSINFVRPPNLTIDSLFEMRVFINDPGDRIDFYRYWTQTNDDALFANIQSVTDDRFFNGLQFEFPLGKAEDRNAEFDPITFGLFTQGDTTTIKWANLSEEHFNFWNTLEFNAVNQGPFSNYTRIETNVEGGLGIWGGYSASFLTRVVE